MPTFAEQNIIHHFPKMSAPSTGSWLESVLPSANRIKLNTLHSSPTALVKLSEVHTALWTTIASERKNL